MPVVVGGTNYYIESLIWNMLVNNSGGAAAREREEVRERCVSPGSILSDEEMRSMDSTMLHERLKRIDPQTANRIHPNNKRKIIR